MVPDYDVYDGPPTTPQGAMNQMGSVSTPIWQSCSCQIRPQAAMALGPRRFVRQADSGRDLTVTDCGKLHVFYSDLDSSNALPGQIWVNYSITLFAPQKIPQQVQTRKVTKFNNFLGALIIPKLTGLAIQLGPIEVGENALGLYKKDDESIYVTGSKLIRFIHELSATSLVKSSGPQGTGDLDIVMQNSSDDGATWDNIETRHIRLPNVFDANKRTINATFDYIYDSRNFTKSLVAVATDAAAAVASTLVRFQIFQNTEFYPSEDLTLADIRSNVTAEAI
jgi:hypothetical protein